MLDILFSSSQFKDVFAFKGGTSLSKAYHKIDRFSEDIDLILDWRVLGYQSNEPWKERSKTQQIKFNKEANKKASDWIENIFVPDLSKIIKTFNIENFSATISKDDSQTVQIIYPNAFKDSSILQEIRLEIGPLAAMTPTALKDISAFVTNFLPDSFEKSIVSVPTIESKRTFWEKVTILHKEANRINNSTPKRYSRHYYDVYKLAQSEVKNNAFDDIELLQEVIDFKTKFYPDNSAKYEDAKLGKIKLLPNEKQLDNVQEDYNIMKNMFFGKIPDLKDILDELKELEKEISLLKF
ncbi:nucleotidyl transferase AbiEii/AbiGii toxin family protein [Xylocopilactobacillus apicola]|nr:nucleotidyl transferase AbiEii/AbiGii toxin family protein [Xylocopilactobacillus apicola]